MGFIAQQAVAQQLLQHEATAQKSLSESEYGFRVGAHASCCKQSENNKQNKQEQARKRKKKKLRAYPLKIWFLCRARKNPTHK
jgi:hypothetical protein